MAMFSYHGRSFPLVSPNSTRGINVKICVEIIWKTWQGESPPPPVEGNKARLPFSEPKPQPRVILVTYGDTLDQASEISP